MPTLIRRLRAAARGFLSPERVVAGSMAPVIAKMTEANKAWKQELPRWDRVKEITDAALTEGQLTGGKMLEIGGRLNPRHLDFPDFDYHALDLENAKGTEGVTVAVGDITDCPHIPDASFDFIFSLDVFEHIHSPWKAAEEIKRLLRPGGVTVHSTLFSWRYHPCPIDYWRYSPEALKFLFTGLNCLHADFDYAERRRDLRGRDGNMVEVDGLGGWRENVRVTYAGQKPH